MTGAASITALIPSLFGVVFCALGLLAKKSDSMNKHSMHAALLLAILGLGGSFGGLLNIVWLIGGTQPDRLGASTSQALMALICIFFIIAGINSFRSARKSREADTTFENSGPSDATESDS